MGAFRFSSSTVWLVFGAFMFALGYEKTGLGHRIALVMVKVMGRNTLSLGYATTLTDAILAPVTPLPLAAPERSIPWWQSAAALWLHAEPAFGPQDRRAA